MRLKQTSSPPVFNQKHALYTIRLDALFAELKLCFNVSLEFVSYTEFKSEWEFCSNKSTPIATTKKHISSHKCKAFYCEAKLHKATTKLSRRRHYLDYVYLFEETPRWSVSIKGGGFAVVFGLTRGAESKTWARGQLKYYAT